MCCVYVHAEKYVVLGTDAQVLSDGAQLSADVLPEDVRRSGGGWEQPCQDGPRTQQSTQQIVWRSILDVLQIACASSYMVVVLPAPL